MTTIAGEVRARFGVVHQLHNARLTDLAVRLLPRHHPDLSVRILRRLLRPASAKASYRSGDQLRAVPDR